MPRRGRHDQPFSAYRTKEVDTDGVEAAIRDLLVALGYDPTAESIEDTPMRVAKYYKTFLTQEIESFTTFNNSSIYDETVVVRDIDFASLCEHHLLPFRGKAHVAYKPKDTVAGLSKLARVVDLFAGRLQLQEQLTVQIADFLAESLNPLGVAVVIEAEHLCMAIRGVRRPNHKTSTTAVRGVFATDPAERSEILAQLRG